MPSQLAFAADGSATARVRGRVLLVNPRIAAPRHARFPLSIMTLAAALEPRYDSTLVDGNVDRAAVRTACDAVRAHRFDAAGITVMGGPQVLKAIELSRAVRAVRPELPIVWGGYFPTLYPDVALNADYVDFVIRGQGEATFAELLGALAAGDSGSLAAIRGLSFQRDGRVIHNPARTFTDRHIAPALGYERLPDVEAYLGQTFMGRRRLASTRRSIASKGRSAPTRSSSTTTTSSIARST
jgi:anaerobic magnesium-protoporphyrin IX monomethyl ester cyclase